VGATQRYFSLIGTLTRIRLARNGTYRIAAFVFALFALGQTYGFLSLRAGLAEARAVFDAMNTVHFEVGGRSLSYGGFYRVSSPAPKH
jgi:hypothetical protein